MSRPPAVPERVRPPRSADERTMLEAWLEYHRATLAMKCDGLTAEQLIERSVPPSTLSLLGLVRHMAEVERHWFRRVLADEDAGPLYYSEANPDGDFDGLEAVDPAQAFATWEDECQTARARAGTVDSLDEVGKRVWHGAPVSLRWILVHIIEEYARHNGHADLLRQRIDGAVGE